MLLLLFCRVSHVSFKRGESVTLRCKRGKPKTKTLKRHHSPSLPLHSQSDKSGRLVEVGVGLVIVVAEVINQLC